MTGAENSPSKIEVLTTEDLEAALRMLANEERAAPSNSGSTIRFLVMNLIDGLLSGCILFALSSGIIVIWFRPWQGLELFAVVVVTTLLAIIKALSVRQIKDSDLLGGSGLTEMARKAWAEKFQTEGCIVLPGCLVWFIALNWMLLGLILKRAVFPRVLIPIALGSLIVAISGAVNNYRKFSYFSRVGRLRERLRLLQAADPEQSPATMDVSEKDRALLSQVEIRQVNRAAAENFEEYQKQPPSYSVAIGPGPLDYLGKVDEKSRHELREVLDGLQTRSRPAEGEPKGPQTIGLETGSHLVTYVVDDTRQRVDVTEISPLPREVQHAS